MSKITQQQILKLQLTFTVHSPVHVGADKGQARTAFTDFVISEDGSEVCYIRPRRMNAFLQSLEGRDRELLQAIRSGMDTNKKDFRLRDFFTLRGGDPEIDSVRLPNYGMRDDLHQEIQPMEKSAGRPYLPGSSIKGAIRTAMLYDWLQKTEEGQRQLEEIQEKMPEILRAKKDKEDLTRIVKAGGTLTHQEKRDLNAARDFLENHFLDESVLFGDPGDKHNRLLSQCFQVADSTFASLADCGVWHMPRERLEPLPADADPETRIPVNREAFLPSVQLRTEVNIVPYPPLKKSHFRKLAHDPNLLGDLLRAFSLANVRRELQELERANHMPNAQVREDLIAFYEDLRLRMSAGEVFFRVGGGKTYYDNSLALTIPAPVIPDNLPSKVRKKVLAQSGNSFTTAFTNSDGTERFWPVTRTVAFDRQKYQPPGWVKLEIDLRKAATSS